ncbi:MAG: HAD family phosphatase [Phyllobacteriaceae bacterium]|nr:HAD family phosphatase [Phyllobacteriaceae bacterium]
MIDHIVFDIGKVLIHYDPHLAYQDIMPDRAAREHFFAEVCTHDWNLEQDRGRTWEEAEAEAIARHPDHADAIRAFRANWHKMVPHAYQGSVDIMLGLIAADRDVTMLTNFASDTFRQAQGLFPFLTEPRGVTVSGDVKLIKPDVAIYELHHANFSLTPARTLFIDDVPANVDAARKAGWKAVRFIDPETLKRDLEGFGVVV